MTPERKYAIRLNCSIIITVLSTCFVFLYSFLETGQLSTQHFFAPHGSPKATHGRSLALAQLLRLRDRDFAGACRDFWSPVDSSPELGTNRVDRKSTRLNSSHRC